MSSRSLFRKLPRQVRNSWSCSNFQSCQYNSILCLNRPGFGIFGISISCTSASRCAPLGHSILFHAAVNWTWFTILYYGRFHHSNGWRVATSFAQKKRNFHCYCLCHQLFCRIHLHHPGWNVHVPNPWLICRQWILSLVLNFLWMYINLLVLWNSTLLWRH